MFAAYNAVYDALALHRRLCIEDCVICCEEIQVHDVTLQGKRLRAGDGEADCCAVFSENIALHLLQKPEVRLAVETSESTTAGLREVDNGFANTRHAHDFRTRLDAADNVVLGDAAL